MSLLIALLILLPQEGGKPMHENRLAKEKSPYLLQHKNNPVDWYPWGEEAFQKAREENKPIFLSVGYSTCHWCHVMERESFESEEIAAVMNQYFINIKVDREERPDIDRIYMTFVQATTGSGGWPMSVWMTADRKPFFGGTYFPPDSRYGRPGFKDILLKIGDAWEKDRDKVIASGNQVTENLKQYLDRAPVDAGDLNQEVLRYGFERFAASYDNQLGGFGGAPKFPRPVVYNFLLRYYARTGEKHALDMVLATLQAMARGGMYDQLGGGFHRYSTDERWHVPHFEKMLYDQAQPVNSYLDAWQITHDEMYSEVAREVLAYVTREMTSPEGGFYSAEDADSAESADHPEEKTEGAFFVWSEEETLEVLGEEYAAIFNYRFGVKEKGNAAHDPHGEFQGKNILFQAQTIQETADKFGKPAEEIEAILQASRQLLLDARSKRPRPHRDEKVLTSWNGLMISAFARAYQIFEEPQYLETASRAAGFLKERLREKDSGRLLRRYRDGEAGIHAFSDDYAFFIHGLLDLHEASQDPQWFLLALELAGQHKELMWDPEQGGFFETAGDDPTLLHRAKESYDGAEPGANSMAALNCLRLAQLTDGKEWREMGEKSLRRFLAELKRQPASSPQMVAAVDFYLDKPKQIIIAGKPGSPDTMAMLRLVNRQYLPNRILLLADGGTGQETMAKYLPIIKTMVPLAGKATAYVCENYACKLPTNDLKKMGELLGGN